MQVLKEELYGTKPSGVRVTQYQYNPKTGKWEPITVYVKNDSTGSNTNTGSNSTNTATKNNSQSEADAEFIEVEYNTLQGDLNLIASKKTIAINTGQTIRIEGLGKYLSGLYYVAAVKRTIDNSVGYSHSLTVIKTGFDSNLKGLVKSPEVVVNDTTEERPKEVTLKVVSDDGFKAGDKVMFRTVGDRKYLWANEGQGDWVPKWVTQQVLTVEAISNDGKKVLLKEVNSWTYVSNLKKA